MSKHLLSSTPGPASYNPPSTFGAKKDRGFSMAGKPRDFAKIRIVEGPGPGSHVHQIPISQGPKYSFASKNRPSRHQDTIPGPGKYFAQIPTTVGKEGPKYSLQGKARDFSRTIADGTPGPGKYDSLTAFEKLQQHGPSYSLQGKTRIREKTKDVPPPGAYNPHTVNPIGGKGTKQYSMTGKPRDYARIKIVEGPGPGSHVTESKIGGPKFSMAKRTSEFSATYVDSINVRTLGLKHPILVTKPSKHKVEPHEMAQLQKQLTSTLNLKNVRTMIPVIPVEQIAG